jgi:hypothetical protein
MDARQQASADARTQRLDNQAQKQADKADLKQQKEANAADIKQQKIDNRGALVAPLKLIQSFSKAIDAFVATFQNGVKPFDFFAQLQQTLTDIGKANGQNGFGLPQLQQLLQQSDQNSPDVFHLQQLLQQLGLAKP